MELKKIAMTGIYLICCFGMGCGPIETKDEVVSTEIPVPMSMEYESQPNLEKAQSENIESQTEMHINSEEGEFDNMPDQNNILEEAIDCVSESSKKIDMNEQYEVAEPSEKVSVTLDTEEVFEEESSDDRKTEEPKIETPVVEEPVQEETVCDHQWKNEYEEYAILHEYIWACNGCGYPLFVRTGDGVDNFDEMFIHPAYQSEKGFECTGGVWHSEMYHRGYCGICGGAIEFRQCAFSMGDMCTRNFAAGGGIQKAEYGEHYLYYQSCACGNNELMVDNSTGKGLRAGGEVCEFCGERKS